MGMVLKRLLLTPTRTTYKDPYQRSFTIEADGSTLNMLEATFAANGVNQNNTISQALIANTMPSIVKLDANAGGIAQIQNGWHTERLRFIMEIEQELNGMLLVSYFQGYTEHSEMSYTGAHDPNMPFYINSVTNVTKMMDPVTNQMIVRPHSVYNVITDQYGGTRYEQEFGDDDNRLIRPVDLINNLDSADMYGELSGTVNSLTGSLTTKVQTSKRSNHDPLAYLTNTVNAFIEGKSMTDLSSNGTTDVYKSSTVLLREASLNALPFIHALHNITGEVTPTTFTLGMLEGMFPYASTVTFRPQGDTLIRTNTIMDTDDTEELYKPNIETMVATTIVHSINSIMTDNLLSIVSLTASNATGEDFVEVFPAQSLIEGIDTLKYENAVLAKVRNVLLPEVTRNGMLIVSFTVISDLLGDTTVTVSVNNGPAIPYRLPTFADSLYAPVVTSSAKAAILTEDLGNVLDTTYVGSNEPTQIMV